MLFSAIGLLALVPAAIAGAAQATYCSEDNLLRAFQHTSASACTYCPTSTAGPYPPFLTTSVVYPASRLASACSCFYRFPTDAPSCTNVVYLYTAQNSYSTKIKAQIVIDPTQPCGTGGFKIVNVCGYFAEYPITFDSTVTTPAADYCYFPNAAVPLDSAGVDFGGNYGTVNMYQDNTGGISIQFNTYTPSQYTGSFTAVSCNACLPCPTSDAQ